MSAQKLIAPIWSASLKRNVTNVLPAVSFSTSAAGYVQPVVMDSANATLLWPAESSIAPVTGLAYEGAVEAVYTAEAAACAAPTSTLDETANAASRANAAAHAPRKSRLVMGNNLSNRENNLLHATNGPAPKGTGPYSRPALQRQGG